MNSVTKAYLLRSRRDEHQGSIPFCDLGLNLHPLLKHSSMNANVDYANN